MDSRPVAHLGEIRAVEKRTSRIFYIQALTLLTQRGNSSSGGEMVLDESLPLSAPAASPPSHET